VTGFAIAVVPARVVAVTALLYSCKYCFFVILPPNVVINERDLCFKRVFAQFCPNLKRKLFLKKIPAKNTTSKPDSRQFEWTAAEVWNNLSRLNGVAQNLSPGAKIIKRFFFVTGKRGKIR